ncbi:MAG TPA: imidazole glycerol phosphate synthase subunit HisH [Kofleriaceae bacterium]
MIAVVDVCSGNLRSVERAIAQVGGDVAVTRDADVVRRADKIVVPGQGAFGMFMRGLVERGLGDVLRGAIASGRPYLGICLGMQVLFDESEEQGPCAGLGVLPGRVVRMHPADRRLKVPHIGWNQVGVRKPDPLLAGIAEGAYLYFDHSYYAVPADPGIIALDTDHGERMTAAVRRDNIFACQFHPEKSQSVGLQMLRNFVERA